MSEVGGGGANFKYINVYTRVYVWMWLCGRKEGNGGQKRKRKALLSGNISPFGFVRREARLHNLCQYFYKWHSLPTLRKKRAHCISFHRKSSIKCKASDIIASEETLGSRAFVWPINFGPWQINCKIAIDEGTEGPQRKRNRSWEKSARA